LGKCGRIPKAFVSKSFSIGKDKKVWVIEFEIVKEVRDDKRIDRED